MVLPTLATCAANPTTAGCSAVLPTLDACQVNPALEGCVLVLPPSQQPTGSQVEQAVNASQRELEQAADRLAEVKKPEPVVAPPTVAKEEQTDKQDEKKEPANTKAEPLAQGVSSEKRNAKTYCN